MELAAYGWLAGQLQKRRTQECEGRADGRKGWGGRMKSQEAVSAKA